MVRVMEVMDSVAPLVPFITIFVPPDVPCDALGRILEPEPPTTVVAAEPVETKSRVPLI